MAKLLGGTTVYGLLSTTGAVFASGGNSNQWNSNYATTIANSANWILDGGNTKGETIEIGARDNFSVFIRTSNVNRIKINDTSGNVAIYDGRLNYVPPEKLTVIGNISASSVIYSSGGNSDRWNSNYTTTSNNSANWSSVYTSARANSATWDSVYTSTKANSSSWNSVYTTTNTNSATWSNWSSVSALYAVGTRFVKLSGDTMTGGLSAPALSSQNIYGDGNETVFSDGLITTGNGSRTLTLNYVNGIYTPNIIYTSNGNSNQWSEAYTNLVNNSAAYLSGANLSSIAAASANWNSTYTSTKANSASWDSVYTTTRDNSASWDESPNITDIAAVSATWNSNYTSTKANSANWNSVYSSTQSNSADWNSTKTTVNANSASWVTSSYAHDNFLFLSGGYVTGTLSVSGSLSGSGQFATSNMLLGPSEDGAYFGRIGIRESSWQVVSGTQGRDWTQRGSIADRRGVAVSSDGRIQAACNFGDYISISYDYGATWNPTGGVNNWTNVAMSQDGRIIAALITNAGYVFISYDYGATWTPRLPGSSLASLRAIAMSSDGRIQAVAGLGAPLHVSRDYGVTWVATLPSANSRGCNMSSDGRIQVFCNFSGSSIVISYDYGATWITKTGFIAPLAVSMSSDGRIQTIVSGFVSSSGYIYTSYDYGVTWVPRMTSTPRDYRGIAISSDGRVQMACHISGYVYISYDYGATWAQRSTFGLSWSSTAMSSDGRIQTVVTGGVGGSPSYIYTSYATIYSPTPVTVNGLLSSNSVVYASGGNSNNWSSVYTTTRDNSASWDESPNISDIAAVSANWNSNYTSTKNNSATWDSVYTTTRDNSATWVEQYQFRSSDFNITGSAYYAVDTTSGPVKATLPAVPSLGDTVIFIDPYKTWTASNLVLQRNGNVIESLAEDLSANISGFTFKATWVGAPAGWRVY
jgi:hypothetical protein